MTAQFVCRLTFSCLLIFAVLLLFPLSGITQTWEFLGPYTGAVEQFWPSPNDPDLIFVRGQLDGGDPDERFTMVSHDGGVSFETSYPMQILTELVYDENDPAALYAISEDEFYISTDTGDTWVGYNLLDHGGPEVGRFLVKQPGADGALFLMAGSDDHDHGFGLYKSVDHGLNWNVENGGGDWLMNHFYDLCFDPHNAGRLFGLKHGIYQEPDSRVLMMFNFQEGDWESVHDPVLYDVFNLRFNPEFQGVMYLEFGDENGVSQTLMNDDLDYPWDVIPGPWDEAAEYHLSFLRDGTSTVITREGQYAQNNPGPDWWQVMSFDNSPLQFSELHPSGFTVHAASLDQIYGIQDHLFIRSLDAGSTWSIDTDGFTCPGAVTVQVSGADSQTLLANAGRFLFLSSDGGLSWRLIDSAIEIHGLLQPNDPDFLISWSMYRAAAEQTPLKYSSDGGESWINTANTPGYLMDVSLHPNTSGVCWIVGAEGLNPTVYRGQNMFTEWLPATNTPEQPVRVYADPRHEDHVFTHSHSWLHKSIDGGESFEQIGNPFIHPFTTISLQPDGEAMTLFSYDSFSGHYSPDRNATWGEELHVSHAIYQLMVTCNGDLLYHGNNFRLYLSEDQGGTWIELFDHDQEIMNVTAHANRSVYAATQYNGIWMLPDGLAVEEPGDLTLTPAAFTLEPAYPNPFNAMTAFTINLPNPGVVRIEVFDVLGRRVSSLANGDRLTAGRHQLVWEASAVASGTYLIRAKDMDGSTSAIRVTLVK